MSSEPGWSSEGNEVFSGGANDAIKNVQGFQFSALCLPATVCDRTNSSCHTVSILVAHNPPAGGISVVPGAGEGLGMFFLMLPNTHP